MRKIKDLIIVGLGSIGSRHLKIISDLRPEINIYVLRRPGYKKSSLDHLIKKVYTNIDEAIKFGFDAAIIASPSSFHLDQAGKFVEKKIPILIEKPISNSLENCHDLKILSETNNVKILVGYVLRHSNLLKRFHKLINQTPIGKVLYTDIKCGSYLPNWRKGIRYQESVSAKKHLGGGVLLELSHEINYVNWLFGPFEEIKSIITNTELLCIDKDLEDLVQIIAINKRKKTTGKI